MQPTPLPPGTPRAFTVAEARAHGIPPKRLRAGDLKRPFHGVRTVGPVPPPDRLRLLMRALPSHAFVCGLTAASLRALPLSRADELAAWDPVHIGVPSDRTRIRRIGVRGFRLDATGHDLESCDGIRVLTADRLWVELSHRLPTLRFVAVTDHLVRRRTVTLEALEHVSERFTTARGAVNRRSALELADARAESPRESMVRAVLVLAGLSRPLCNVDIRDGTRFVARVDMLYPAQRLIIEYDGDYHNDRAQWSKDQRRRAELESLGYRVTVVTARDFDDPPQLVARIRRLLAA